MHADAFTGGVKPGGLTSVTEIRILLCYLIRTAGPITREILQNSILQEQLVNYFEMNSCLDDLLEQGLVTVNNDFYMITQKGKHVADSLCWDIPRTVRESAANSVLRMQHWAQMSAENQAEIVKSIDGYQVHCRIQEGGRDIFVLTVPMPDKITAEKVRDTFIKNGSYIYSMFIEALTKKEE